MSAEIDEDLAGIIPARVAQLGADRDVGEPVPVQISRSSQGRSELVPEHAVRQDEVGVGVQNRSSEVNVGLPSVRFPGVALVCPNQEIGVSIAVDVSKARHIVTKPVSRYGPAQYDVDHGIGGRPPKIDVYLPDVIRVRTLGSDGKVCESVMIQVPDPGNGGSKMTGWR